MNLLHKELSYQNIVLAVDRDIDGSHIAGLLLGLFANFAPYYLKEGRVFLFVTPLVTIVNKKRQFQFMFSMKEYQDFRKKFDPKGNKFIYDYKIINEIFWELFSAWKT